MDRPDSNDLKLCPFFAHPVFDIGTNWEYLVNPVGNSSWIYTVEPINLLEEFIRQPLFFFLMNSKRTLSSGFQPWKQIKDLHQRVLDTDVQYSSESMAPFALRKMEGTLTLKMINKNNKAVLIDFIMGLSLFWSTPQGDYLSSFTSYKLLSSMQPGVVANSVSKIKDKNMTVDWFGEWFH